MSNQQNPQPQQQQQQYPQQQKQQQQQPEKQEQEEEQALHIVTNASEKTKQFYQKIFSKKWLPGMKREMPRKCIFSLQNLKNPVRNLKCQSLECVYEYENLKTLRKQHSDSKGYKCINCGSEINSTDIFQDEKILSILYFDEKAYINNDLLLINSNENPYFAQAKEFGYSLEQLENQNAKIFEYYLMQTMLKQKLEMLESMKNSEIFKDFANKKNIIEELQALK